MDLSVSLKDDNATMRLIPSALKPKRLNKNPKTNISNPMPFMPCINAVIAANTQSPENTLINIPPTPSKKLIKAINTDNNNVIGNNTIFNKILMSVLHSPFFKLQNS